MDEKIVEIPENVTSPVKKKKKKKVVDEEIEGDVRPKKQKSNMGEATSPRKKNDSLSPRKKSESLSPRKKKSIEEEEVGKANEGSTASKKEVESNLEDGEEKKEGSKKKGKKGKTATEGTEMEDVEEEEEKKEGSKKKGKKGKTAEEMVEAGKKGKTAEEMVEVEAGKKGKTVTENNTAEEMETEDVTKKKMGKKRANTGEKVATRSMEKAGKLSSSSPSNPMVGSQTSAGGSAAGSPANAQNSPLSRSKQVRTRQNRTKSTGGAADGAEIDRAGSSSDTELTVPAGLVGSDVEAEKATTPTTGSTRRKRTGSGSVPESSRVTTLAGDERTFVCLANLTVPGADGSESTPGSSPLSQGLSLAVAVTCIALNRSATVVACGTSAGGVCLWKVARGAYPPAPIFATSAIVMDESHAAAVQRVMWVDDQTFVSIGLDCTVHLWSLSSPSALGVFDFSDTVRAVDVHPRFPQSFLVTDVDQCVHYIHYDPVEDAVTGVRSYRLPAAGMFCKFIGASGGLIAIAAPDASVMLLNSTTMAVVVTLPPPARPTGRAAPRVIGVDFLLPATRTRSDSDVNVSAVAGGGSQGGAHSFDGVTEVLVSYAGAFPQSFSLPSGRCAVSYVGENFNSLGVVGGRLPVAAYSDCGRYVVSGCASPTVYVWERVDGVLLGPSSPALRVHWQLAVATKAPVPAVLGVPGTCLRRALASNASDLVGTVDLTLVAGDTSGSVVALQLVSPHDPPLPSPVQGQSVVQTLTPDDVRMLAHSCITLLATVRSDLQASSVSADFVASVDMITLVMRKVVRSMDSRVARRRATDAGSTLRQIYELLTEFQSTVAEMRKGGVIQKVLQKPRLRRRLETINSGLYSTVESFVRDAHLDMHDDDSDDGDVGPTRRTFSIMQMPADDGAAAKALPMVPSCDKTNMDLASESGFEPSIVGDSEFGAMSSDMGDAVIGGGVGGGGGGGGGGGLDSLRSNMQRVWGEGAEFGRATIDMRRSGQSRRLRRGGEELVDAFAGLASSGSGSMVSPRDIDDNVLSHLANMSTQLIEDEEAVRLWERWFSKMTLQVPFERFVAALGTVASGLAESDHAALKMALSCDDTVTMYAFGSFMQSYGPARMLLANLRDLCLQPWYYGHLSHSETEHFLNLQPVGTFLVRLSRTSPGCFSIAFVNAERVVVHILVKRHADGDFMIIEDSTAPIDSSRRFTSFSQILEHYKGFLTRPFISSLPWVSWFYGDVSTESAELLLSGKPIGTYLARFSSVKGYVVLTTVQEHGHILHVLLLFTPDGLMYPKGEDPNMATLRIDDIITSHNHLFRVPLSN